MTDPDRSEKGLERLERRTHDLSTELSALQSAAPAARRALTARALALGVLVLTAVPWLSYSDEQYQQGDWYSGLSLVHAPAVVVDSHVQQGAVVVLLVATVAAMVVPTHRPWAAATGAVATLAVLVVFGTRPADTENSFYTWSSAPYLALVLALVLTVVQLASTE